MFKHLSWSLVGQLSTVLFQFVGLMILSKIIPPSEYGIIGIITFFTNIADMLIDSGMGGALIYKKDPDDVDFSTLFIYNMGVSLILYSALFFAARPLATFYEIPRLSTYVRVYGLSIIAIALCITQDCKLKRKMDFKTLSIISISANAISLASAIIMARHGLGIWALIAQTLIYLFLRTVALYIICGLNSVFRFSVSSFKEQFGFGGWLFLANIVHSICNNIYSNIIPKVGTLTQNGYYTQSAKIAQVPSNTISLTVNNVFFPFLAQSSSEEEIVRRARGLYRKVFHLSFPMFLMLALLSYEIIMLVLGKDWVDAVGYLRILLFSGIFDLVSSMLRNFLKSEGMTRDITVLEIIKSVIKIGFIAVSLFWGIKMLIYSILASSIVNMIVAVVTVARKTSYSLKMQMADILKPLAMSVLVFGVCYGAYRIFPDGSYLTLLLFLAGYILYAVVGKLLHDSDIEELFVFIKGKIRK